MTCAGVLASLISIGSQSHISKCGAMVFDFPALRLSLNRAEDQVKRSIGIGHDRSCELHRLQSSGTAKSLGAWFAQDRAHARGRERRHGCAARSDRRLKGRPDGLAIPRQQAASGLRSTPFTRWRTKRENLCQGGSASAKIGNKTNHKKLEWWERQDSNLRRHSQRIYSPPPLPLGTLSPEAVAPY